MATFSPTLIVGLGTSGLKVVNEVQKLMYETFGKNSFPIIKYVVIETNNGARAEETPLGSDFRPLHATVSRIETQIQILKNNDELDTSWIPDNLTDLLRSQSIDAGAANARCAGRLALWANPNTDRIAETIRRAQTDIMQTHNRDATQRMNHVVGNDTYVYVTGTLTGGTCSGMCIDLGYMIRDIFSLVDGGNLYGIFALPKGAGRDERFQGNTHRALQEIDFFRTNSFEDRLPFRFNTPHVRNQPPYTLIYLISKEWFDSQRFGEIASEDGLYRLIAFWLFCDIIGMNSLRRIPNLVNVPNIYYMTWGISGINYPKYAITEYTACELGEDLCRRWLSTECYSNSFGQPHRIVMPDIQKTADNFWQEAVGRVIATMRGDLLGRIFKEIVQGKKDGTVRNLSETIRSKFTEERGYYGGLWGNVDGAIDTLKTNVEQELRAVIIEKENINYVEVFRESLEESRQYTLKFWRDKEKRNIPLDVQGWKRHVDEVVERLTGGMTCKKILLRSYETLESRLRLLLEDMEIFVFSQRLTEFPIPGGEELVKMRENIETVKQQLEDRRNKIEGSVTDTTLPFRRKYNRGTFYQDVAQLKQEFVQSGPNKLSSPEMDITNLWDFLLQGKEGILEKIKGALQARLINRLPSVDPTDMPDTLMAESIADYARRADSALLRLDVGGTKNIVDRDIPKYVIGGDERKIQEFIKRLNQANPDAGGFNKDMALEISDLSHTVVFYSEIAGIRPDDMIYYRNYEDCFQRLPRQPDGTPIEDITISEWQALRSAHNIQAAKNKKKLKDVNQFVLANAFDRDQNSNIIGVKHAFSSLNIRVPGNRPVWIRGDQQIPITTDDRELASYISDQALVDDILERVRETYQHFEKNRV